MSLAKVELNDIGTLANPASARQALNDNFQKIEDEFKKVVYRDGSTPNSMEADLDMNSKRILNVADGKADSDAVNKRQMDSTIRKEVLDQVLTAVVNPNTELFLQDGDGAVPRTIAQKLRERVSVEDFFVEGDADYTDAFERASVYLASIGGGIIHCRPKVYSVKYLKLRTGVWIVGESLGDRIGGSGTVIRAVPGENVARFIERADNSVMSWGLVGIVFHGSRNDVTPENSGAVDGLYLFKEDDGVTSTNDTNDYAFIDRCVFRNFSGNGWVIGGAGLSGGKFYNIKNLFVSQVTIRDNIGVGIDADYLTDSYFSDVILSRNKAGAIAASGVANSYLDRIKGFYNGEGSSALASMNFNSCERLVVNIQTQEEFIDGVRFRQCNGIVGEIVADATGYPASDTGRVGVILSGPCENLDLRILADSFQSGFVPERALSIEVGSTDIFQNAEIVVNYKNQSAGVRIMVSSGGVLQGVRIVENGTMRVFGTHIAETIRTLPTTAGFNRRVEATGSNSYLDTFVSGATGQHNLRNWRYGVKAPGGGFTEAWYKGDGTDTVSHRLQAGGSAFFCEDSNCAWNAGHLVLGTYHLWIDSSGRLRIKPSAPTHDTDGVVVGTQS